MLKKIDIKLAVYICWIHFHADLNKTYGVNTMHHVDIAQKSTIFKQLKYKTLKYFAVKYAAIYINSIKYKLQNPILYLN